MYVILGYFWTERYRMKIEELFTKLEILRVQQIDQQPVVIL
jgi:hypothetical protein